MGGKTEETQDNGIDEGRRGETITTGKKDYRLWERSSCQNFGDGCRTKGHIETWVYNL